MYNKTTNKSALAGNNKFSFFQQTISFFVFALLIFQSASFAAVAPAKTASAAVVSNTIVISQFQVGGANTADEFLELHNVGNSAIDINGYQLVYRSSAGTNDVFVTSWTTPTVIPAGGYYLITNTAGYDGSAAGDKTFTSSASGQWSGSSGGLALRQGAVNTGTIIDSVGYGSASNAFVETAATSVPASNASKARDDSGCKDTDNNSADFILLNPSAPRNSSTAIFNCSGSTTTNPSGAGAANPNFLPAGADTLLTVTVSPGTNPTSTGITVVGNLTAIGGSANQTFFDDGTNGDVTANDNVFSFNATVASGTAPGGKTLPVAINDAQSRTGNAAISLTIAAPPKTPQPLPFSQDWTNTNLITADNDWSGVPGIVGYRGDGLTTSVGTDPQTITADGANTPINVIANQIDPNTVTSGGNYEFELTDPVVAFQGSGTANAPHIVINLDTTGGNNITISYNLRDLDGSTDNAVQPVALQYRIGDSGDFTNIPSAFVPDATTGPNEATLVTPVAIQLPSAVDNQPLVQLRFITANAIGNDEFVGIDDINIVSNGVIPLSGSGTASPSQVQTFTSTRLRVNVNPATNPASTNITVTGDLTSIGGSAAQQFYDDGTNGDVTAGDNIFSYVADIPGNAFGGGRTIPVSISDAENRTASTSISLTVIPAADPQEHLIMGNPSGATMDINNPFDYLLAKPQYALSYHRDRAIPNWVSWHLDTSWIGSVSRQDDFRPDLTLPDEWYHVTEFDYIGSGFDRGHHSPSGDRTRTVPDNSATFFMTNMMPQSPDNNQGPWEKLESESRLIAGQGNELYIVAAGVGNGGTGLNGGTINTIAGGKIAVPSYTWKVILVLPIGDNDVSRVNNSTRTIAVIMPNTQGIKEDAWQKYLATVDQVEALTGYDFFSNVPTEIQNVIEARLDPASNANPQTVSGGTYANLNVTSPNTSLTGNITITGNLNLGGSTLTTGSNFCVTLGQNATVSRISGYINGCVIKQFPAIAAPVSAGGNFEKETSGILPVSSFAKISGINAPAATTFVYPVGTTNGYSPLTATVTQAQANSSLAVTAVQTVQPNVASPNLALKRYWTLTESGDLTADLTFKYLDADVPVGISENNFKLQKYDGVFTEIPATIDAAANTATATNISQFSDWTLVAPAAPTASGASVSGRIFSAEGRGISAATIVMTDVSGIERTARTNQFGYFRFEEIESGNTYVVNVSHKRYFFAPQVVNVSENLSDLNFTAFPR